jgi:hypothetical protein
MGIAAYAIGITFSPQSRPRPAIPCNRCRFACYDISKFNVANEFAIPCKRCRLTCTDVSKFHVIQ